MKHSIDFSVEQLQIIESAVEEYSDLFFEQLIAILEEEKNEGLLDAYYSGYLRELVEAVDVSGEVLLLLAEKLSTRFLQDEVKQKAGNRLRLAEPCKQFLDSMYDIQEFMSCGELGLLENQERD